MVYLAKGLFSNVFDIVIIAVKLIFGVLKMKIGLES